MIFIEQRFFFQYRQSDTFLYLRTFFNSLLLQKGIKMTIGIFLKFFDCIVLDYSSITDQEHLVVQKDRVNSMSNHQYSGLIPKLCYNCFLDCLLCNEVNLGVWFVYDDYLALSEECPDDAHKLAYTSTQVLPSFLYLKVEHTRRSTRVLLVVDSGYTGFDFAIASTNALVSVHQKFGQTRPADSFLNYEIIKLIERIQVPAQSPLDKFGILSDHCDFAPQLFKSYSSDVNAIDQNLAIFWFNQAHENIYNRRFSRTVAANDAQECLRFDIKADVFDYMLCARLITRRYFFELYPAFTRPVIQFLATFSIEIFLRNVIDLAEDFYLENLLIELAEAGNKRVNPLQIHRVVDNHKKCCVADFPFHLHADDNSNQRDQLACLKDSDVEPRYGTLICNKMRSRVVYQLQPGV